MGGLLWTIKWGICRAQQDRRPASGYLQGAAKVPKNECHPSENIKSSKTELEIALNPEIPCGFFLDVHLT